MAQLTNKRLILHGFFFLLLVCFLIWYKPTVTQAVLSLTVFTLFDLVYLSFIIIRNMRPQPGNFSLKGMRVMITGGNSGIGFELAKEALKSGASSIILVARNQKRLEECKKELELIKDFESQQVSCLSVDLSADPSNATAKIKDQCEKLNGLDVLINCAGYSIPGEFENLSFDVFRKMSDTNYIGSVLVTHAVVPFMIHQQFGQIVFLSSIGGQIGVYGFSAYSPSKFAVRGLAEVLYSELKPHGIGVSIVYPPDTETPGLENENKLKPKITQLISGKVQAWSSKDVASVIINGIEERKFMIGCGSDGYFVNALTCGATPPSSVLEFWLQCMLMPILRVYILFVQNEFFNMISNEVTKRLKTN